MSFQIIVLCLVICFASCSCQLHGDNAYHYATNFKPSRQWRNLRSCLKNYDDQYNRYQVEQPREQPARRIGVAEGDATRGDTELCRTRNEFLPTPGKIGSDGVAGVTVVYCENADGPCVLSFPPAQSRCKQLYAYNTLTVMNSSGIKTYEQSRVPSGCICVTYK